MLGVFSNWSARSSLQTMLRLERKLAEPTKLSARVLCVASGKGGTGKSIVATNLALRRALTGERVLLIDFDTGMANAHLLLGLAPRHDLSHVLSGAVSAADAVVEGPGGLHLLSGGVGGYLLAQPSRRELERLFRALAPLEQAYDLIVIDHGAGLSYASLAQLCAARCLLLVVNHESTALSDGYALYKRVLQANSEVRCGLLLNRVPSAAVADAARERFLQVSQRFLGRVPESLDFVPADPEVGRSVEERRPVVQLAPDSPAAVALTRLAEWESLRHARTAQPFFERSALMLR